MTDMMVKIMVEILDILAIATKEIKQSQASEFVLRLRLLKALIGSEKFLKKVVGRTDLEDGMQRLEKLTAEEVRMASAQLLKVTHNIEGKLTGVDDGVRGVDEKVQGVVAQVEDVQGEVQVIGDRVREVGVKVQVIVDGGHYVSV